MRLGRFFPAGCLAAFALVAAGQTAPEAEGFSVRGWSAIAPEHPHVAVRDLASGADGFYVAADVAEFVSPTSPFSTAVTDIYVARLDSAGEIAWSTTIEGEDRDVVRAVAVDLAGFVYLAGSTQSADFPRLNSVEDGVASGSRAAFLWKIDPASGSVVYSTLFGAAVPRADLGPARSEALDVTVDSAGNAYVTGWTNSRYFPVSDDAFDPDWSGRTGIGVPRTAFVAKFGPNGKLLYATYLGGEQRICSGGSNCIGVVPFTDGLSIVLGPGGDFFVGGVTNTTDFPVSDDAYQTKCRCTRMIGDIFVVRFAPDGRTLDYATYLGGSPHGNPTFPQGTERLTGLAVDSAGAAYLVGWTTAPDFPTTMGSFQEEFHSEFELPSVRRAGVDGFVTKLSPDGRTLEFSTFFGGLGEDIVASIALRPDGAAMLMGFTKSEELAATAGFLQRGSAFLATLRPDGSAVEFLTRLASGRFGPDRLLLTTLEPTLKEGSLALSADLARVAVVVDRGVVSHLDKSAPGQPRVWALTGAADAKVSRFTPPGGLVSLFGVNIGPEEPASFELDGDGRVPFELSGVRVRFDGTPAPILYAQDDQINVVAPFNLNREGRTSVQVFRGGSPLEAVATATRPASPAIFPIGQGWAILNADGTLNSESPSPRRGVVAVWATGAGVMAPLPADGSLAEPPFAAIEARLRVLVGHDQAEADVLYAGAAPGLVHGVVQINFRLPENPNEFSRSVPLILEIGGVRSALAFVRTKVK